MKNLKKIISVTAAAAMVMSTVAPVSVFAGRPSDAERFYAE